MIIWYQTHLLPKLQQVPVTLRLFCNLPLTVGTGFEIRAVGGAQSQLGRRDYAALPPALDYLVLDV